MQDFQPVTGGIFGGGVEHRRVVGYPAEVARQQQQQQAVKCPRCNSANTKFCYYNNYNHSQPRHFCKSCRRYWTMGGVLRNVPIGGGCRKSKRPPSSSSSSSKPSSRPSSDATDEDHHHRRRRRPSSASRCSSDSPSLRAVTTATTSTLLTSHMPISNNNPPFEPLPVDPPPCPAPDVFQDPAAVSFTDAASILAFNFPDQSHPQEEAAAAAAAAEVIRPGLIDQTVPLDPGPGGGDLPALDWPEPADSALFDLTSAVDPVAYWNQSHWLDADPSLYLP
ncbi:dof zinc finger protein 4-like [Musa acuminata AAA Group]|uniref:Dof zinc finger protein n=1 Tax=Musa acuminata subsp. malaccensis TaxID=214687 RepID=A0A804J8S3_MUSAM|nr:PREDICTED: dof zinc finger protein DOF5.4-like [Musa acuminata subsp. malaccensis]CAG1839744.1 unnamed protein product [Musa acuminata subsp. malaccensis]